MNVCGFPSRGNHVAHTCTGNPADSAVHPFLPKFISKYRNHHAPLPSANPHRRNHTSYRRFIPRAEYTAFICRVSNFPLASPELYHSSNDGE